MNATDRISTLAAARDEWHRARPATAMAILARAGFDMAQRRSALRTWGISFDDQIDYSADSFLTGAGFGPDGSPLDDDGGESLGDAQVAEQLAAIGGSYEVVLADGRRIGRMSLDAELGPVARGFAYAWPMAEAAVIAERFGGKVVAR